MQILSSPQCSFTIFTREHPLDLLSFPPHLHRKQRYPDDIGTSDASLAGCCHLNIFDPPSPTVLQTQHVCFSTQCDDRLKWLKHKTGKPAPVFPQICYGRMRWFPYRPSNKQSLCLLPGNQEGMTENILGAGGAMGTSRYFMEDHHPLPKEREYRNQSSELI